MNHTTGIIIKYLATLHLVTFCGLLFAIDAAFATGVDKNISLYGLGLFCLLALFCLWRISVNVRRACKENAGR